MILAIDTATQWLGIALHDGTAVRAEIGWHCHRRHTVELAPTIDVLCRKIDQSLTDLSGIAVAIGPGSYTGLRVGLATAKGIALANNTPLFGISTLDVVAHAFGPQPGKLIVTAAAGRGRVAWNSYAWQNGQGWLTDSPPEIDSWSDLLAGVHGRLTFCGEIDAAAAKQIRRADRSYHIASPTQSTRRAGNLAELAWTRLRHGETGDADSLAPIYLRDPAGQKIQND